MRLSHKLVLVFIIVASVSYPTGCSLSHPTVPNQDIEMASNLSGVMVIECLIDTKGRVCYFNLRTKSQGNMIPCEGNCVQPSLAPDSEKIVFIRGGSSERVNMWLADTNGQYLKPLVQDEVAQSSPLWSPDGNWIAYKVLEDPYTLPDTSVQAYRHSSIYIVKADGTDASRLTPPDGNVLFFDWAPDSERIVTSGRLEDLNQDGTIDRKDRTRLYIVDLASRNIWPVLDDVDPRLSMHHPSWSPDGNHIAYIEGHGEIESYGDLVIVETYDGSEVSRLDIGPGTGYSWSPSGDKLAYVVFRVHDHAGYDDLFVFDLPTKKVTRLTETSEYSVFSAHEFNGIKLASPVWSLDGRYLAFIWKTGGKDYIVAVMEDGTNLSLIMGPGHYNSIIWGQ